MTNSWSRLAGFTHIKEKRAYSNLRGNTPRERTKKMDQEACVATSTEVDEIQDAMDQKSLEKDLKEGD